MNEEKGPKWYMRLLKKMLGEGLTKQEAHETLAGSGKHTRQRRRPRNWVAKKRKLRKIAQASRRRNR